MAKNKAQIKFEAETSEFNKQIKQSTSSIKSLNNELKLNQTQLKGAKDNTNLLSERVNTLKQKYDEQSKVVENTRLQYEKAVEIFGENSEKAETLKNKLTQAKTAQQNIANAINETNKKLILQSEKFITVGESISKAGNKIKEYGNKIEIIGNKLSVVSASVGALAVSSVKASIDFETAFTGVEKTVDGTTEQLAKLREGILDMSTKLPSSAVEISAVAEAAGQLGIQTDNILDFSKAMIDLGNSTNLTADEAASQLAKFANIMQMSQKDFDKLGSSIVDLGNHFATTEADIVDMSMRLAGAGKQVGLSEGQVLGLATALSSVGIEAEMGGSAISKAIVKMQNAVEQGGTKLNDILKKTGVTLKDLELMSANDSKGFKDLSQSIGMTSTEVKQLVTAATNLEDFARISGMTVEQFKKAWKEDAAGALSEFIKGLGDAENKGESAITMLSEMGLTEVRLRDSLLRAANAGTLFNDAIETGTKAWNQNIALTNEASKRYETTESKLKILKNQVTKNAIALGDELKPSLVTVMDSANSFLTKITTLTKSFNNLSNTTKQNIIKFGGLVVALGPTVKITGNLLSTVGSLTKSYGNAIKSVGEWSAKIKISATQTTLATTAEKAKTLATTANTTATNINTTATNAQTAATTIATVATNALKVAMIALPIVGIVTGIVSLVATYKEMTDETTQTTNKIKEQKEELENLRKEQQKQLDNNLSEIDNTKRLRDELSKLVDENGKVKEGYEKRVNFILSELNKALGTEYQSINGVIEKYAELSNSIDNLIEKKKANIILESQEENWKNAIQNQSDAIQKLTKISKEYNDTTARRTELEKEWQEINEKINNGDMTINVGSKRLNQIKEELYRLREIAENYNNQKETVRQYYEDISTYETNAALITSGTAEDLKKVNDSVMYSYQVRKDGTIQSLQEQILIEQTTLQMQKEVYEQNQSEITKNQINETNNRLKTLADELVQQTNTTNIMSSDIIEAWSNLANKSYEVYSETISEMSPEMQKQIQEVTGVIVLGTPSAEQATKELSDKIINQLNDSEDARKQAIETLKGYLNGLTDEQKRELLKQAGIEDVDEVMKGLKEGNLAEDKGISIITSLCDGLKNNTWQGKLFSTASSIATKLSNMFSIKASVNGNQLPGHKNGLDYVPYDNYIARLHRGERVLTKEENEDYMNGNIQNKIATRNITVQFYPQTMSEQEIERAEKYIRRKWGLRA